MKLIKSIEVQEAPNDPTILLNPNLSPFGRDGDIIHKEIIYGRRFREEKDGEVIYDFVIGATADVNKIFGKYAEHIPSTLKRVGELEKDLGKQYFKNLRLQERNEGLKEELNQYKTMSFWGRLKFLCGK